MTQLLYVLFPAADYVRCLRSDPPILKNHDEDRIGASVFRDLIGEGNLVLMPELPKHFHKQVRADVVIGFRKESIGGECLRIAFSGIQNAYLTAMDQERPLDDAQLKYFKSCLHTRQFAHDDAYVVKPQDLRQAALLGVVKQDLLAAIRDISSLPHELFRATV